MAVAGLHNVSVYDSAFLRESQPRASSQWGEQDLPSTRASSILQMWRELEEGEHVVSHPNMRLGERPRRMGSETSDSDRLSSQGSVNGNSSLGNVIRADSASLTCSQSLTDSENEHEDNTSFCSEQSSDLGEIERERVRQIFREWMSSGVKSHSPNASHRSNRSRAPWLGQNECERVRIIREWVQMNSQRRGSHDYPRDEGIIENGSQIEHVRDGQLVCHPEIVERRPIRKLCGRQAILDMLMKAQRERKKELQDLLGCRPVSDFAHRNRIQSLLRGRFLLNRRLIHDERPACTAVSELGLLRQRHAVSDLKEGFLSRLDHGSTNDVQYDASSNNDCADLSNEQSQSSNEPEVQGETGHQVEHGNSQVEIDGMQNIPCNTGENANQQDYGASVTEVEAQVMGNNGEHGTSHMELISGGHRRENDTTGGWQENNVVDNVETLQAPILEAREMYNENNLQSNETSDDHEADGHTYGFEGTTSEEFPWQVISTQDEEWQDSEAEHGTDMQQFPGGEISAWTEVDGDGIRWQEDSDSQWYHEPASDTVVEQNRMQESDEEWQENVLQEAIDSWLDVPPGQEADSAGRVDSLYFPDEENIQSMELRELLSRRRVSTLLRSGFRESLDQLVQSYVQRQNDASAEWELDEASSSSHSLDHQQEPQHHPQDVVQPSWGLESQGAEWPDHNTRHHIGNEWEILNELRIDMARLHQRMDNMQSLLEACMDMQLELQRSVRQEVSAALNRSLVSADSCKAKISLDDAKWDHVRRGVCCICGEKNIDSLLYRCGHMCTCSKCAEELVHGGKCPMCCAPVIEVIRAYFIQ